MIKGSATSLSFALGLNTATGITLVTDPLTFVDNTNFPNEITYSVVEGVDYINLKITPAIYGKALISLKLGTTVLASFIGASVRTSCYDKLVKQFEDFTILDYEFLLAITMTELEARYGIFYNNISDDNRFIYDTYIYYRLQSIKSSYDFEYNHGSIAEISVGKDIFRFHKKDVSMDKNTIDEANRWLGILVKSLGIDTGLSIPYTLLSANGKSKNTVGRPEFGKDVYVLGMRVIFL